MNKKIEQGFKPRTWLLVILIIIALGITVILVKKYIDNYRSRIGNYSNSFTYSSDDETQKKIFDNKKYENQAGSNRGTFVKNVLDDVIADNKDEDNHKITVVYEDIETQDEEEIRNIKNSINSSLGYEVKLDYNEEKNVNKITISYIPTDEEKNSFNTTFEQSSGSTSGFFISNKLDKVITINKTNERHKITVVYNEIRTQDEEQIRSIKNSLNDRTDYEVILDYDENGFVNKITIR